MVAGVSVALIVIPQALAYAVLAGLEPVQGLYAAVAAALVGALVGSSPYLQNGPTAVASLLTFGALSGLPDPNPVRMAQLAALLAVMVGVIRLVLGLVGGGVIAYLMSQPVVVSFSSAAGVLIVASQVPSALGLRSESANPVLAAVRAVADASAWVPAATGLAIASVALLVAGRRWSARFPAALVAVAAGTAWSAWSDYDGAVVGEISFSLEWPGGFALSDLVILVVPAVIIAIVGFAEPATIARRYATEDRRPWDPNRELVGQGLANLAAGLAGGFPSGGSFSRSALNRLSGARTRWSGAITGLAVLALLPMVHLLAELPIAVLAGLVMAAAATLVDFRSLALYWRLSRPQFVVAAVTVGASVLFAPRVEWGVVLGVVTGLAVHLWRENTVEVPSTLDGDELHLWPAGVLYFGSAPGLERTLNKLIAEQPDVRRVVIHLRGIGRVDLTGALMLRDVLTDVRSASVVIDTDGARAHDVALLTRVLAGHIDDTEWRSC